LIQNEIKLLNNNLDYYTKILYLINAREKSLNIIKTNIHQVRIATELNDIANDPEFITIEDEI